MRVSIDCRYIRERPSGIGAYVQALVDRLPARARDVKFHFWASPMANRPLSREPNVEETVVAAEANNVPTIAWPSLLAPIADADVVHMPYNVLGRGIRASTVVTVHDLMWLLTPSHCEASGWRRAYQVPFYRAGILMALRNATRIVAISRATADAISRAHPDALPRVRVIHHGVEARYAPAKDESAARAVCERAGVPGPFLLAMGQNAPYKNHAAVLEAFAAAPLPEDVRLVFVQRLSPRGELAQRAQQLGLGERVVWVSAAGPDVALALVQSALGLVQFSLEEGFGMPALEAMACGTPVIVSDTPALTEVVEIAGLRVPLGDVGALSRAMSRLVREPSLRAEQRGLGIERARAFNWDACALKHLEVYREAAAVRGA